MYALNKMRASKARLWKLFSPVRALLAQRRVRAIVAALALVIFAGTQLLAFELPVANHNQQLKWLAVCVVGLAALLAFHSLAWRLLTLSPHDRAWADLSASACIAIITLVMMAMQAEALRSACIAIITLVILAMGLESGGSTALADSPKLFSYVLASLAFGIRAGLVLRQLPIRPVQPQLRPAR